MTSRDFIVKAFNLETKVTHCSSLMTDGHGNVYSYGYHYPLLFTVNDKVIRNVRGYSNTTARHILWSRDVDAIDVHTLSGFRLSGSDNDVMTELIKGQKQYVESCQERLDHHREMKRRTDTRMYAEMLENLRAALNNLAELSN